MDGFVFRVDMRLRPYGQSGALVLNFAALEEYYLTQGRDWERYAMIKARVVAGEPADAQYLHAMLRPFIYRKYLDFGSIESLRDLKRALTVKCRAKVCRTILSWARGYSRGRVYRPDIAADSRRSR